MMNYLVIPLFILIILIFLWIYYLYRIEFIHESQLRTGWWWLNGILTKETEEEILASGKEELIKDYYKLRRLEKLLRILSVGSFILVVFILIFFNI